MTSNVMGVPFPPIKRGRSEISVTAAEEGMASSPISGKTHTVRRRIKRCRIVIMATFLPKVFPRYGMS
jgi:hypothetical protein